MKSTCLRQTYFILTYCFTNVPKQVFATLLILMFVRYFTIYSKFCHNCSTFSSTADNVNHVP